MKVKDINIKRFDFDMKEAGDLSFLNKINAIPRVEAAILKFKEFIEKQLVASPDKDKVSSLKDVAAEYLKTMREAGVQI